MDIKELHEVMTATQSGRLTFPEVVSRLSAAGVESYFVDFASADETFYMMDGSTHREKMILSRELVNEHYSAADLVAAIRGAQADRVRYPEFVKRATAAGVISYWAFLTGRKVIYFGRKGEMHIEEFPNAKS